MVRWRGMLRAATPAVLIFVLVPLAVIAFSSNQNINVLFGLILLLQLYVIIIQAEITLRQSSLSSAQYEPVFLVLTDKKEPESRVTKIRNVGQPAYNIMVTLFDRRTGNPLGKHELLLEGLRSLSSQEEIATMRMSLNDYVLTEIELFIVYFNVLGETKEVSFWKPIGDDEFFMRMGEFGAREGFLLRSLENLVLLYKFWRHMRHRKKKQPVLERSD